MRYLAVLMLVAVVGCASSSSSPTFSSRKRAKSAEQYDLVVYGGTPGGIAAALAATRGGATAVVIEPSRHIGGMVTGGLSHTDRGRSEYIGGIAREFFERADARYGDPKKTRSEAMFFSEPHVAEQTFTAMLWEAGVDVVTRSRLATLEMDGARVTSIGTDDGATYRGRMFVDATYEGDLMARVGVTYTVGREGTKDYGESLAGFRPAPLRPRTAEYFAKPGSAYTHGTPTTIPARDESGKLLWGINPVQPWPEVGSGDGLVQSYNFRVIATTRPSNRVPFPKPTRYDPARYEILLRMIRQYPGIRFEKLVFTGGPLPGDKYDLNASGLVQGTDHPGTFNTAYPDGDAATRDRIWQDHADYVQGFLYFLGNDPRVPEDLRRQTNMWGLAKDEFVDNGHWPYAMYVREARRMVGAYVMRQQDCQAEITKPDAVAMGSFILDSHALQRLVTPEGNVTDEGNFDVPTKPYQIAYRAIVPMEEECENLFVPVCLSATHVAYGSIRMEPQFMCLGHAAGVAAVMAMHANVSVQDVDLVALQAKLREQGQIVSRQDVPGAKAQGGPDSSELPGIVVDDGEADFVGEWFGSAYGTPVDGFAQHDNDAEKGRKTATFEVRVPADGRYEVRFAYVPAPNRATKVPVTIVYADGIAREFVNEKERPAIDGHFVSLGDFRFEAETPAIVRVSTDGTQGHVSVDAVQLIEVK